MLQLQSFEFSSEFSKKNWGFTANLILSLHHRSIMWVLNFIFFIITNIFFVFIAFATVLNQYLNTILVADTALCRKNQKNVYGVARHEKVNILCEVDAYPPPDKFEWSFNHSQEINQVLPSRYEPHDQWFSSTFNYTPMGEMDYGTVVTLSEWLSLGIFKLFKFQVMCWANNLAGKQREPCIFHVIGAGKPDPLHNCSIVNRTNDSLEVECTEGFDGGQPQNFLLEVSGFKR